MFVLLDHHPEVHQDPRVLRMQGLESLSLSIRISGNRFPGNLAAWGNLDLTFSQALLILATHGLRKSLENQPLHAIMELSKQGYIHPGPLCRLADAR